MVVRMALPRSSLNPSALPGRLRRTDWFDAGLVVLGVQGIEGVRLGTLCSQLGITTGSFYHHFSSRTDFLQGLIDYWSESQVDAVIALVEQDEGSPLERVRKLENFAVQLGIGPQDQAMRTWAKHHEPAQAAVRKADRKILALIDRLLRELGVPNQQASLLSRVLFFSAIGSYAAEHLLSPHRRGEVSRAVLGLATSCIEGMEPSITSDITI